MVLTWPDLAHTRVPANVTTERCHGGKTMLTITFGIEDIGRIRFATAPAPVLEMVLMLFELRHRPHQDGSDWRHRVRSAFPTPARPLNNLVADRDRALFLDVLTPDAEEAFHILRTTAPSVHQNNVGRISRLNDVPTPTWLRRYGQGDVGVIRTLDHALRSFHATCLTTQWASVTHQFHDDIAQRTLTLHERGAIEMLNALSPDLTLSPDPDGTELVLQSRYPWDRHVRLNGHGLVLMPSAFWTGHPLITWDPLEPSRHVLIYPTQASPVTTIPTNAPDPLAALLGRTRANVLRALTKPRTTTGIARRSNISPSSASEHAATLRDAGLLTSHRQGQATEHRLTPLGETLLRNIGKPYGRVASRQR